VLDGKRLAGTTMYFIDYGSASAMVRGVEATKLESGDYFGEMSFIATCRRSCCAAACAYSGLRASSARP
jgi:hypothetical protein